MEWLAVASALVPPTWLTTLALITSQTLTTVRSSGSRCSRSSSAARMAGGAWWSVTIAPFGRGLVLGSCLRGRGAAVAPSRCGISHAHPSGRRLGQHVGDRQHVLGVAQAGQRHEDGADPVLRELLVPAAMLGRRARVVTPGVRRSGGAATQPLDPVPHLLAVGADDRKVQHGQPDVVGVPADLTAVPV